MMEILVSLNVVHHRPPRPLVSYNNSFDRQLDDGTAIHNYRFTISQLECLSTKLRLPHYIITSSLDRVDALEALAMLCRRLAEPSRLFSTANEFGRSIEACSRIITETVRLIYRSFSTSLFSRETSDRAMR
ncbi:hypothetical protein Ae201684P_020301 [Aphanomyces euteiches]|uniref:Uncharacterized protein n=1 Tax=Aphanomyces euteiches TaxID=100861 RepID=A0A6G0WC33_9STRA|nr:hypothetical protein Ae201684_016598 [Aphanomyces euteiches]KAH9084039.1 hypothetical protein Ae201684P_020301 [Aphanomyces euteiches]